ncbi:CoA ester lyase [Temperatibacter marinus]|uniref:CoA ester lyase n=1 Tax=Temperatibacter marinus TaxID=1456591 RepID=A0AA52H8H3_9PROT|nr:CoA ester lyase [Temperatibacter marinus]WND01839.1 CoA ester lyase [Temperatibacter marinus]
MKLRRSVLFMPASNERALEKAKTIPADVLVFDLEDAVAPGAKEAARVLAVKAANSREYGEKEILIRSNAPGTPWWKEDLKAICQSKADGLVVPKVSDVGDIMGIQNSMYNAGAPCDMKFWAMIETASACLNIRQIAESGRRLAGFMMGANDLTLELHAKRTHNRLPIMTGMGMTILAARANDLCVLDSVYNDFKDITGFEAECQQAEELGFDGKTLIHPNQVASANSIFSPTQEEILEAKALINTFAEAQDKGQGVATFKGKMIEELHVREAERLLAFDI